MKLKPGQVLFHQGDTGSLYHLKEGLLKIVRVKEDGTSTLVNLILPGEIFPHHSLLTQKEYFGTAVALLNSEVEIITSDSWYHELDQNPERLKEIALVLQEKLRMMQQRIDQLTAVKPAERFELAERWFRRHFPHLVLADVLNQEEIGQFIGVRRETVNRLLRKRCRP
ncbi:putative transcriptional regulator, Crp/Fnr family [Caldalkalibacillus thermarum TA2.A1]|uniref:Crp/Fnr family transcriptional regulator n=1 Tax=Caldalkalibacillus thermarum (strain TA2.A1) TaxID=986075 RepID=F5L836_CALTT|nr:Crp/Fnr family transcriptional regulator [Caldalkalibacillus thermarum]EGL82449.1 putative transcriptional regulator, Crp/Fnr family [Caldalkalibacillus thermarum TA2.A1]QZT33198.1 Crp/Fnr family transcriptional regulator [Caldalkalibacillus thermarum TA2.A1]GGK14888.1 Crp/Fnr family transcriptional regulator [Caldalkalibacillus thermarum]